MSVPHHAATAFLPVKNPTRSPVRPRDVLHVLGKRKISCLYRLLGHDVRLCLCGPSTTDVDFLSDPWKTCVYLSHNQKFNAALTCRVMLFTDVVPVYFQSWK